MKAKLNTNQILLLRAHNTDLPVTSQLQRWFIDNPDAALVSEKDFEKIKKALLEVPRIRSGSFSPSQLDTCKRKQIFSFLGVSRISLSENPTLAAIFNDGKWRHIRWQANLLAAQVIEEIEYSFFNKSLRYRGSLDGYKDGLIIEAKGTSALNYVVKRGKPNPEHELQGAGYFVGIPEADQISFIYECKMSQRWEEFNYPRERFEDLINKVNRILQFLNESVESKTLPEILRGCKKESGKTFKECPYKNNCLQIKNWEEAEAQIDVALLGSTKRSTNSGRDSQRTIRIHRRSDGKKRATGRK